MCSNLDRKIRSRCISPKTMMWSTHSRRTDPICRSAKPFCQGGAGAGGSCPKSPAAQRRGWCGRLVPNAHGAQSARDDAAIDPVAIADQVARGLIPRKCLRYLTCNPFRRGICCDVDPDEVSAAEPDDDEGVEQVETDSWNNEQVHGGDVRRVVTQEGSPSLAGWPPSFDHVLGDARLRDLKPELEQFAVDAWRGPKRIFDAHPPDQYAQLRVDLRPPSPSHRLPTPITTKAGPVPTHERLGPDGCENLQD